MTDEFYKEIAEKALEGTGLTMFTPHLIHAGKIAYRAQRDIVIKYAKGVQEHGGNIWEVKPLTLLKETRNEGIDTIVYTDTAIEQLENYHPTDLKEQTDV